jgi:hypothetical protein
MSPDREKQIGFIYFASADSTRFVKIGWGASPVSRLNQIQTGCPHLIVPLGCFPARRSHEGRVFEVFSAFRVRGEWFERAGSLDEFLNLFPSFPMLAGCFDFGGRNFTAAHPAGVFEHLGIANPPRGFRTPKQMTTADRWIVRVNRQVDRFNKARRI